MANVAVVFKVYTDEGKEQTTADEIKKSLNPKGVQLEEVAFGIKIVKVLFVHDDKEGSDVFEDRLRKVKGVTEVEVLEESLIS